MPPGVREGHPNEPREGGGIGILPDPCRSSCSRPTIDGSCQNRKSPFCHDEEGRPFCVGGGVPVSL